MHKDQKFGSLVAPARSVLISPAPIGLGSPYAESLVSFFSRVALQNDLTPGQMVHGGCTRRLSDNHPDIAIVRRITRSGGPRRTISVSPSGLKFATALARLVGRPDAQFLHWGFALQGYSFARLTRQWDAFCPDCLRSAVEPHQQMIWEVDLVTACKVHRRRLVTACAGCGQVARRIGLGGRFLHCPHCGHDRRESQPADATDVELAVAEQLGNLIAEITKGRPEPGCSAADCVSSLLAWAGSFGATSVKRQARFLCVSQSTVSLWRNRRFAPSLTRLIELSLHMGLSATSLLRGEWGGQPASREAARRSAVWSAKRISDKDRPAIIAKLEAFADRNPTLGLPAAASELGVSTRTLRKLDPGLCRRISAGKAANLHRIKEAKLAWFCQKVDDYVAKCVAERRTPKWRSLSAVFAKPGLLREKTRRRYAKAAIRNAARDLPLQPEQLQFLFLG